jgi:hypothetical protein
MKKKTDIDRFVMNTNKTEETMMVMAGQGRGLGEPFFHTSTGSRCRLTHARSDALVSLSLYTHPAEQRDKQEHC